MHMSDDEKQIFLATLRKHETLFDGTLGQWKDQDLITELKEGSTPYHARSFPMPKAHAETLKSEVDTVCSLEAF